MSESKRYLLPSQEIEQLEEQAFRHPLNPNSELYLRNLSDIIGLQRVVLRWGRIPPGKESFIYHAHQHEEEFMYILSGRGIAEINDEEFAVSAGDFLAFPTPSVAHHLRNPFDTDLIYLMGGERQAMEIGEYPRHNKCVIRDGQSAYVINREAMQPFFPRHESP
jgi:uncharacterized cupin superfamily protein